MEKVCDTSEADGQNEPSPTSIMIRLVQSQKVFIEV